MLRTCGLVSWLAPERTSSSGDALDLKAWPWPCPWLVEKGASGHQQQCLGQSELILLRQLSPSRAELVVLCWSQLW